MKTCSEKALEWNVTPRTVNAMCKNGRIQGAVKEKRTWLIPDDAEKPLDGRISTGKYSRKKTGKEKKTGKAGAHPGRPWHAEPHRSDFNPVRHCRIFACGGNAHQFDGLPPRRIF